MVHLVAPVLAAAAKPPAVSRIPSTILYVLVAVELVVGIGLAELRRWMRGTYPWRLHSVVWGLFLVITSGFALLLEVLAWFTTKPRAGDVPRRGQPAGAGASSGGRSPSPLAQAVAARIRRRRGLPTEPEPPTGVVPGTYGTSLPPHDSSGDLDVDPPAGWLPDPSGRHQYRYWNGRGWSRHVADAGNRSTDDM
jgi:Protein of unknown function (DUF2510)